MVKIDEILRTSTFAWSLDGLPFLATGTVAGTVDVDFNASSKLELWDVFGHKVSKKPLFEADTDSKFFALAWSKPFEGRPRGLLVGAFEDGSVEFWDAEVLIKKKDLNKASVLKSSKHSGSVRALLFNPNQHHILVTGGSNGEIFVWDTKSFSEPFSPGQAISPMDEVTSIAWNNSVNHIFASTGNSGYTSIWDLKSKREVLHLSYSGPTGRANFSFVAWHPTQSTKLVTASDNDSCALILTWDLRNSNAPEKVMEGHKKGVLSLDWCQQDPELLLSSGKDNTAMLWNPIKGIKLAEYPTTANWAFYTKFAPSAPDIFATASFDGKIVVQTLQDTSPPVSTKVISNDDNEFWNELSITDTQQPSFDALQAPSWLKSPVSAEFGFGSKLISVTKDSNGKSVVKVERIVYNKDLQDDAEKLKEAFKSNNFDPIMKKKGGDFINETDKSDWELLKKFSDVGGVQILNDILQEGIEQTPKPDEHGKRKSESENIGDSFFDELSADNGNLGNTYCPKGSFALMKQHQSKEEKKLMNLVLSNKIEDAVAECLEQNKLTEALILALNGSEEAKEKVKTFYFKENEVNELSRVIYSASSNNVTDIVGNADISNWKEIASCISSFCVDKNDFNPKIVELGDRILSADSSMEARNNAIICYFAGNSLEKVAGIWLREVATFEKSLLESKKKSISSPSDARYEALHNFVEKLASYRAISNMLGEIEGPARDQIAKAILDFANIVTGYGQLELAEQTLSLIENDVAGLDSEKDRIKKAFGIKTEATTSRIPANTASNHKQVNNKSRSSYGKAMSSLPQNPVHAVLQCGPQVPISQSSMPTMSFAATSNNAYQRSTSNPYAPAASGNIYSKQPNAIQAPGPNVVSPPPSGSPTASYKQETEGWNDLPNTFKLKAPTRRPAPVSVFSPSPMPLTLSAPMRQVTGPPTAPPPPKGMSRTASISTPVDVSESTSPRLGLPQANTKYAPPSSTGGPAVSGNPSSPSGTPYGGINSPLVIPAPPPKNAYAPPAHQTPIPTKDSYAVSAGQLQQHMGPASPRLNGPGATILPKNPYAPLPSNSSENASPLPTPKIGGIVPPPSKAIRNLSISAASNAQIPSLPHAAQGQQAPISPPPPQETAKPKYAPGDRSHIPEKSLGIYKSFHLLLNDIRPKVPERFAKHGVDMDKRLNILFDHLNNDDLLSDDTIAELTRICSALDAKDYATANSVSVGIAVNHSDEIGDWHTGVKRLLKMAEAL